MAGMIHFHCPECNGKVKAEIKHLGDVDWCPWCRLVIDIHPDAPRAAGGGRSREVKIFRDQECGAGFAAVAELAMKPEGNE